MIDNNDLNQYMRYDMANNYFQKMVQYKWFHPEFIEANNHKQEVELYILAYNQLPNIDAYCQAVVRAWRLYCADTIDDYWRGDMEGLAGITTL